MKKRLLTTLAMLLLLGGLGCSQLNGEDQFVNKATAPAFVTQLYSTITQTVTVKHDKDQHISWAGFVQSHDFRYFKIKKIQVGEQIIVEDGQTINGQEYIATSTSVIKDISVKKSESANNEFVNGSINVSGQSDLRITVEYSPLVAIKSQESPHLAYLILYYDKPKTGALRVKINGYTDGVKAEKCAQPIETMELHEYSFKNGTFNLYLCGGEVARTGQNNTPQDPSAAGFHGVSTNLAAVPVEGTVVFYQPDEETLCVLSEPEPTIPAFDLPIPEGIDAPLDFLPVSMLKGSFAECSLDPNSGAIACDENINLKTLVPVSKLSASNTAVPASELLTAECDDFGSISGSGTLGDDEMSFIVYGRVLSDVNTEQYNISDALIVSEIILQK